MTRGAQLLALALAAVGLALVAGRPGAARAQQPPNPPTLPTLPAAVPVCPGPPPLGAARCHAQRRTDRPQPKQTTGVAGLDPADLRAAYALGPLPLAGATVAPTAPVVAIVDAYDHPQAEQDLATYRAKFGLPPCTTADGCFRKVNQRGDATPLPAPNSGWAQEIALDLAMVSAVCPACRILLVEADNNYFDSLGAAVNLTADATKFPGVAAISNSYGAKEGSWAPSYERYYNHPNVAVTVSSGDNGYGVEFPASSQYVIAVGGTSLTQATGTARGWSETVWSGAGSGCSGYIAKPAWQTDRGCARRTVADVAAVADPYTGVAIVYNGAWYVFGGTSAAAPIIAAVRAQTLAATTAGPYSPGTPYDHTDAFFDVTTGRNGRCNPPRIAYLCAGGTGYDGPTGLGTPNGTAGF